MFVNPSVPALTAGHYFKLGIFQVSLGNLLILLLIVALFVAALVVPFPGHSRADEDDRGES